MNISILIRHSGIWESDILYNRYQSDGIIIGDNIFFVNLRAAIAAELGIDERRKKLRFNILLKVICLLFQSAMTWVLSCMLKLKKEPDFGMYPLCVDISNLDLVDSLSFDAATEMVKRIVRFLFMSLKLKYQISFVIHLILMSRLNQRTRIKLH